MENKSYYNLYNGNMLREVMMNIGLKRINTQEGVTVKVLLDSRAMGLVISLEFARKQGFKLKKIEMDHENRYVLVALWQWCRLEYVTLAIDRFC